MATRKYFSILDYIHIENKKEYLQCGSLGSDKWESAQWSIENEDGNNMPMPIISSIKENKYFLKNKWTRDYIHIQDKKGYVQYGTLGSKKWESAQWFIEKVEDNKIALLKKKQLLCSWSLISSSKLKKEPSTQGNIL